MQITYKSYTIQVANGVFEISQHGEVIDTAETLSAAKAEVDAWRGDVK